MLFGTWSQAHAYDPSDYMESSHTSAIIGHCKTKKLIELVSKELPVRHNTRCLKNIPDSY